MDAVNHFFENKKKASFFLILVLSTLLTCLIVMRSELRFMTVPNFMDPVDHHKYIFMAKHPFDFFIAPFCWRVALPLAAGILPFDLQTSFLTLTFLCVVFSGVMIYYVLHGLGLEPVYALSGLMIFYAAGWIVRTALINFWVPNAAVFFIIITCIYLIVTKQDIGFMLLLMLGVTVKESAIFVAPLYYTLHCRSLIDWRTARRTVLLALPAVVVLLLFHFVLIPAQNDNQAYVDSLPFILTQVQNGTVEYNYASLLQTVALSRLSDFLQPGLFKTELFNLTVYPFGPLLTLLPFLAIRKNLKWLAKFWPYLLLVYIQILFAVSTISLLFLALPVLILLAVTALKEICSHYHAAPLLLFSLPLATFALNLVRVDDNYYTKELGLLVLVWLAVVYVLSKIKQKTPLAQAV